MQIDIIIFKENDVQLLKHDVKWVWRLGLLIAEKKMNYLAV